ncbi:AAA family ATPase [Kribbella jejuensis]|uniref:Regulatory LuxR family protein n=1 Tax=Kribbella jejuensis TaxID=236068 RepID=A0A542DSY0_9ACTN|nr:LuxR family transcriptional regulator [Kribbella jejuensis]TQJ06158.1 regulatory LuxR family protein [Kribbella jejuensis]
MWVAEGMVGRRRELDALRGWLAAARAGAGRVVLCSGEAGIGKSRLAQEAGRIALAGEWTVAWGRCPEVEGAPAFWPWRQVLRAIEVEPDVVFAGRADRFTLLEDVSDALRQAAEHNPLLVVLDDIHRCDEPSLLVLRHLADRVADQRLLVFATYRAAELPRVLPELMGTPALERIELRPFGADEIREQLAALAAGVDAAAVSEVTGGNPLFVREVARAMLDGTWRPSRPPRSVLDVVQARLSRVSADCRAMLQAAATVGRDFQLGLVAAARNEPIERLLPAVDEAVEHGLIDRTGGDYRFVHVLTRDAVEATLATAERLALHRAVADALRERYADDLSEHLADIARHWACLAPYGEASTARAWAARAADDAVRRLAYEEGVRLYRTALGYDESLSTVERHRLLVALGRSAYFAGDPEACGDAAVAAMNLARRMASPELMAQAALVVEPTPDLRGLAKLLCDEALAVLSDDSDVALRARLLAQRAHLALYDGDLQLTASLSREALELARTCADDGALTEALYARQEACPTPTGVPERLELAAEMLSLARRTDDARLAMWGQIWRIGALVEDGRLPDAASELAALRVAAGRVGGPVGAWHLDRVVACVSQARGRFGDAAVAGRRAFERMRIIEPTPAAGRYFALHCALARHVGITEDAAAYVEEPLDPPPPFVTMTRLHHAFLLLCAGRVEAAAAAYRRVGPPATWVLPPFFVLPAHSYGVLVAEGIGRTDDVACLLGLLEPYRGRHVTGGNGVVYLGPVDLILGRGADVLGDHTRAVKLLEAAVEQADRAGAEGFAAEARYHLAVALLDAGDSERATTLAADADRRVRALGMAAYTDRTAALVTRLDRSSALSEREAEVARLVGQGLTNRRIAEKLVISERTAENHVQHILAKLGFANRSQIAAWIARTGV